MKKLKNTDKTKQYTIKTAKTSNKDKKTKKKHPKLKKFIIICFILCIILFLAGVGVFAGIFFSDKWKIEKSDLEISIQNSVVYDKDGKKIAELTGEENRKVITLAEMGDYLPNAFVAIEDERFYSHYGIDIKRTAGAIVTYILHGGKSSFGGSTITQQLVKNMMGDRANKGAEGVERKIREWSRAYQIEQMFSKSQILELYLNKIFMGSTVYGVESASQYYFSKSAKDLSLAEAAFIAGINHSPNGYSPFGEEDNSEKIKTRTKVVLEKMKSLRNTTVKELEGLTKITEEEYDKAISEVEKGLKFKKGVTANIRDISFHTAAAINEVAGELAEIKDVDYDTARSMIFNGGYKLYTTQDSSIQDIMEEEYLKTKYIKKATTKKGKKENAHSQSSMTIIDHKTGKVVGIMGGLGSDVSTLDLNRAVTSHRQPGSSIKPLAAVGPGLEEKIITAATLYDDVKTSFGGNVYKNVGAYRGIMPVRQGIECSSNMVNMKVLSNLGIEKGLKYVQEFGLSEYDSKDANITLALGGTTHGASSLEMAAAYAAIANKGEYIEPTFYTKLEDSAGKEVLKSEQEKRRVISEQTAYVLINILKSPVYGFRGGATATQCAISGMETAAKTGTSSSYKDKWLCGMTPYYAAATWFGFDEPETISGIAGADNPSKTIWAAVMKKVHKGLKNASFTKPSGVVSAKICTTTGKLATDKCSKTYSEVFISGTVPEACDGHDYITVCKESGKLATEFCPEVEEKENVIIPEREINAKWKPVQKSKTVPITEECTIHTADTMADITVPYVLGYTLEEAKQKLAGFKVTIEYDDLPWEEDGIILKQSLAADTEVKRGTEIVITVNNLYGDEGGGENNDIATGE